MGGLQSSGVERVAKRGEWTLRYCMTLLSLIIAIVVVGIVLWAVDSFVPMEASTKKLLKVVVILVLVVWLLNQFGILDAINRVPVHHR